MPNSSGTAVGASGRYDKLACLSLVLVLAVLYGLCQNSQWVPGGSDGAYYLAIARNLATGNGYFWNDTPVVTTPPGWPITLAGLMKLSGSFAFLNLVPMVMCMGAACLWYLILRRFSAPLCAWLVVLVAAILFEWHRMTFTFYSESLFYLLLACTMLLAIKINEGPGRIWEIIILLILATAMVSVRWTGLLATALSALALVAGQIRPRLDRKWLTVVLLIGTGVLTFKTIQPWQKERANIFLAREPDVVKRNKTLAAIKSSDSQERAAFKPNPRSYVIRVLNAGRWLSTLFWPPTVMGMSQKIPRLIFNLLGWTLILLLAWNMFASMRQREWAWLGLFLFCVATVMIRYSHVARYLAPVAPMLLLGIWRPASRRSSPNTDSRYRKILRITTVGLLLSIGICNLSILAVNAWVAHSKNFVNLCLAGEYRDILSVAEYLQRQTTSPDKVGVYVEYHDVIRKGGSFWAERALVLLTDRNMVSPASKRGPRLTDDELLSWAKRQNIKYIVTRPPKVSARLWHIKMPSWGNAPVVPELPYYVLLEVRRKKLETVELRKAVDGLRTVPGL